MAKEMTDDDPTGVVRRRRRGLRERGSSRARQIAKEMTDDDPTGVVRRRRRQEGGCEKGGRGEKGRGRRR
jgi:hypothetical protein